MRNNLPLLFFAALSLQSCATRHQAAAPTRATPVREVAQVHKKKRQVAHSASLSESREVAATDATLQRVYREAQALYPDEPKTVRIIRQEQAAWLKDFEATMQAYEEEDRGGRQATADEIREKQNSELFARTKALLFWRDGVALPSALPNHPRSVEEMEKRMAKLRLRPGFEDAGADAALGCIGMGN